MAVEMTRTRVNNTNQENVKPNNQEKPEMENNTAKAVDLLDLLQNVNVASSLSQAAKEYDAFIFKYLGCKQPFAITLDRFESRIYTDASCQRGIAIIFDETYHPTDYVPAVRYVNELCDTFRNLTGGHLMESIVITPEDYPRVEKMAAWLQNAITSAVDTRISNMTVDTLTKTPFFIQTDMTAVRSFIDRFSPHAVPTRDDVGALICVQKDRTDTNGNLQRDIVPILAFTGYTEFVTTAGNPYGMTGTVQFVPIVTITDVVSQIMAKNFIGMVLPIAADYLIRQNAWLRPYSQFTKDKPNIGRLIPDPANGNQPWFATDMNARNEFLQRYIAAPQLAVDIADGRARIPGIDNYANNQAQALKDMGHFLNLENIVNRGNFLLCNLPSYTGTVSDRKSTPVDSRCVDYLSLAAEITDVNRIADFLYQPNSLDARLKKIAEFRDDVRSLYMNTRAVFSPEFVQFLTDFLTKGNLRVRYDFGGNAQDFNVSMLLNSENNFNKFAGFQPQYNNWNNGNSGSFYQA